MSLLGMWVHGTTVQVEAPENLAPVIPASGIVEAVSRRGWGAEFYAKADSRNWFHISIPTPGWSVNPVNQNGAHPKLLRIFYFYKTIGTVNITDFHIYDGPNRIKEIKSQDSNGTDPAGEDHSTGIDYRNHIEINPPVEILFGLGISLGVDFIAGPPNYAFPSLLFTTVGADFDVP
jgi:hypothetical protein